MQARLTARLEEELGLTLNARKTEAPRTGSGVDFLGYRLFSHHRLLRRRNVARARRRLRRQARAYEAGEIDAADVRRSLAGWLGHARLAGTYDFSTAGCWAPCGCAGALERLLHPSRVRAAERTARLRQPPEIQPLLVHGAVPQIEVDQVLVRHPQLCCE